MGRTSSNSTGNLGVVQVWKLQCRNLGHWVWVWSGNYCAGNSRVGGGEGRAGNYIAGYLGDGSGAGFAAIVHVT